MSIEGLTFGCNALAKFRRVEFWVEFGKLRGLGSSPNPTQNAPGKNSAPKELRSHIMEDLGRLQ
eukprot:7676025-Pyramimonas_sp.AAC.1